MNEREKAEKSIAKVLKKIENERNKCDTRIEKILKDKIVMLIPKIKKLHPGITTLEYSMGKYFISGRLTSYFLHPDEWELETNYDSAMKYLEKNSNFINFAEFIADTDKDGYEIQFPYNAACIEFVRLLREAEEMCIVIPQITF